MANYTLEVPSENVLPFDVINFENTSALLKNKFSSLSSVFKSNAETSNIDKNILVAISYTLTGLGQFMGQPLSNSKGLMLWNRKFAPAFLQTEFNLGRLSEQEISILKKNNFKINKKGLSRLITAQDQMNNEFNVMVGSIILGQLIDNIYRGQKDVYIWNQTNGVLRLDRIFAMYLATAWFELDYTIPTEIDFIRTDNSKTASEFIKSGKSKNSFWVDRVANLVGKGGYLEITVKSLT